MANRKIGVTSTSFAMPFDEMLPLAKRMGIKGVQLWCAHGEHDAKMLSKDDRLQLLDKIHSHGMVVTALCAEVGGFTNPDTVEANLETAKAVVDMAVDMDVYVISGHIGVISDNPNDPGRLCMNQAMIDFGDYCEQRGKVYASETGPESIELMREFIDALPNKGIKLNYDPANLIMKGINPVKGVLVGRELIVHTHVKDGVRYMDGSAEEVPVGTGQVPFGEWFAVLDAVGYDGFFTIEREVGANRVADIKGAIEVIRSQ
ncbi:MAG: sugar phosphate isomerase/epimerase [Armatimonadetes bacterium]|nr:sugar phosphate isomerase/epimerase [Armatimonadota bacterium]